MGGVNGYTTGEEGTGMGLEGPGKIEEGTRFGGSKGLFTRARQKKYW